MATPPSFWPAPDAAWRLDSDLVAVINTELTKPLHSGISKLERHNLLQKRLADLGAHLGYNSQIEVETGHRKFKRSGRFDVVWTCRGEGLPIIFEIDSCWRQESLLKLGRVGEEALKLWVYYGQRPFPLTCRDVAPSSVPAGEKPIINPWASLSHSSSAPRVDSVISKGTGGQSSAERP